MRKVKLIRIEKDAAEAASKQLKKNPTKTSVMNHSFHCFFWKSVPIVAIFWIDGNFCTCHANKSKPWMKFRLFFGPKLERKLSRLDQLMYQHVDPTAHERVT
jgi:hypothetical protein